MMSQPKAPTAAQARSEPEGSSGEVMATSPPAARTTWAMRSSSVATTTRPTERACSTLRRTRTTIGTPSMSASGFPGNRLLA